MRFTPGYGIEHLHLGQTSEALQSLLGVPQQRRKVGSFREYWLYPNNFLDGLVSRRTGRVLSLFFRDRADGSPESPFGMSEDEVRTLYQSPDHEGGGLHLAGGGFVGRWLTYDSGIGFHFDQLGHVETISIFAPKRKSKKITATTQRLPQIAALRRA